ncbi:SDR family NAD(P)-dependent oxidoreductase [Nocardia sp. NPDC051570]|uniref:SDR family NAD(P)-dependent oxidoreductase n=1 Tax=Nocardia sp. NPDC051570 TaxID=3364324 RepID=UPI0037A89B40
MAERLSGRTALVTGSTSGIGRAIAEAFATEGAHIVVSGRRLEEGAKVVAGIRERGGTAEFVAADLAQGAETITVLAAEAAVAAGGRIDILVNNAGYIGEGGPSVDFTEDAIDTALATNIKAPFLLTAALVPGMVGNGGGTVINIGSSNAIIGMPGYAMYGATKAALHSLTTSWAAELGPLRVRVNTIAPGPTATEANEPNLDMMELLMAGVPSRRLSQAEEIAAAALFLACDESANVHGATISVDGGLTAALWLRGAPPEIG